MYLTSVAHFSCDIFVSPLIKIWIYLSCPVTKELFRFSKPHSTVWRSSWELKQSWDHLLCMCCIVHLFPATSHLSGDMRREQKIQILRKNSSASSVAVSRFCVHIGSHLILIINMMKYEKE
jgi:hypothetical protein